MAQILPVKKAGELQSEFHTIREQLSMLRHSLPDTYTSALADIDAAIEDLRKLISHVHPG